MNVLVPRNNSREAAPKVLIVLDVDGVLNQLPDVQDDAREIVERRDGAGFPIRVDMAVIDALDEQARRPGVQIGWLTTWGEDVDRLIAGPFEGRLSGGYVIASRPDTVFVPIDWKLRALLLHLEELGDPAYVWADDDAVHAALLFRPSFAAGTARSLTRRLLFRTDPITGLMIDDIAQVQEFIDRMAD